MFYIQNIDVFKAKHLCFFQKAPVFFGKKMPNILKIHGIFFRKSSGPFFAFIGSFFFTISMLLNRFKKGGFIELGDGWIQIRVFKQVFYSCLSRKRVVPLE